MTDEEALKEIDRQEKRFAAEKCGRGLRLAKSARERYETMIELHQEAVDAEAGCLAAKHKAEERSGVVLGNGDVAGTEPGEELVEVFGGFRKISRRESEDGAEVPEL